MTGKVQPLHPVTAPEPVQQRSPERAALAEKIANLTAVTAERDRVYDAHGRAEAAVYASNRAIEEAEEALALAREREPSRLVQSYLGEADDNLPTVKDAEAALRAATAQLETARRARDLLSDRLQQAEQEIGYAESRRDAALGAMLQASPEVIALLSEYRRQQERTSALAEMLRTVSRVAGIPREYKNWESIRTDYRVADLPGVSQWVSAINGLRADADAALPQ